MNFLFVLAQAEPPTEEGWFYPLVFPAIAFSIGLFLFFKGKRQETYGVDYKPRKLALPLFVVTLGLGLLTLFNLTDTVYRMAVMDMGRRVIAVHILAPLLGLIGIAVIVWDSLRRRKSDDPLLD